MAETSLRDISRSEALKETARKYSPSGVHSAMRAAVPLVFERAEGAHVWDAERAWMLPFMPFPMPLATRP